MAQVEAQVYPCEGEINLETTTRPGKYNGVDYIHSSWCGDGVHNKLVGCGIRCRPPYDNGRSISAVNTSIL